jgi:hypothetical protein
MPRAMNKHGFTGVRKRCTPQHWRKPYYARFALKADKFIYSRNFATAEEAASAYQVMKAARSAVPSQMHSTQGE